MADRPVITFTHVCGDWWACDAPECADAPAVALEAIPDHERAHLDGTL